MTDTSRLTIYDRLDDIERRVSEIVSRLGVVEARYGNALRLLLEARDEVIADSDGEAMRSRIDTFLREVTP